MQSIHLNNFYLMCGRFGFFELRYFIELLRQLEIPFAEDDAYSFAPGYNIAPDSSVTILLGNHNKATLANAQWGLIPHWAESVPKVRPINARGETLGTKPYFRRMFRKNHCLIPASGFFEWKRTEGTHKQPYYIHRIDNRPMAFAALWDRWQPPEKNEKPIISCTIITTEANREMLDVHDRMPVILEPENWKAWLEAGKAGIEKLLQPAREGTIELYPVSTLVNNPQYIKKNCIDRLDTEAPV